MRIKILEVGQVTKEKTFFVLPLKYESDGKIQDKKIFSFNTETYKVLKDAVADQFYEVKLVKDKNGYWQWENVGQVVGGAAAASTGRQGTYETPEERARRQVLIVRQSCLAQSVATGTVGASNEDILDRAFEYETWVNRE